MYLCPATGSFHCHNTPPINLFSGSLIKLSFIFFIVSGGITLSPEPKKLHSNSCDIFRLSNFNFFDIASNQEEYALYPCSNFCFISSKVQLRWSGQHYRDSPTPIATFSVPTKTADAQRTEILGPTLAALLVATMEG